MTTPMTTTTTISTTWRRLRWARRWGIFRARLNRVARALHLTRRVRPTWADWSTVRLWASGIGYLEGTTGKVRVWLTYDLRASEGEVARQQLVRERRMAVASTMRTTASAFLLALLTTACVGPDIFTVGVVAGGVDGTTRLTNDGLVDLLGPDATRADSDFDVQGLMFSVGWSLTAPAVRRTDERTRRLEMAVAELLRRTER